MKYNCNTTHQANMASLMTKFGSTAYACARGYAEKCGPPPCHTSPLNTTTWPLGTHICWLWASASWLLCTPRSTIQQDTVQYGTILKIRVKYGQNTNRNTEMFFGQIRPRSHRIRQRDVGLATCRIHELVDTIKSGWIRIATVLLRIVLVLRVVFGLYW